MKSTIDICDICKQKLTMVNIIEDKVCYFCKNSFQTNIYCSSDHFICDSCHVKDILDIIESFATTTDFTDPYLIADSIMTHPKFKSYGPEHHILVPVAILTALKNRSIPKESGSPITDKEITEAISRGKKVPGGWCGFFGSCGAGIGAGIAISIFTDAAPSKNVGRSLANLATSHSLEKIADYLEHCCKRSLRISIQEALRVLHDYLSIDIEIEMTPCNFYSENKMCEKERCNFFNKE